MAVIVAFGTAAGRVVRIGRREVRALRNSLTDLIGRKQISRAGGEDKIERLLAELPDRGPVVPLRIVEDAVSAADHSLANRADTRSRCAAQWRNDPCSRWRLEHAFWPAIRSFASSRVPVDPVVIVFRKRRVDLVMDSEIQGQLIRHAPFIACVVIEFVGADVRRPGIKKSRTVALGKPSSMLAIASPVPPVLDGLLVKTTRKCEAPERALSGRAGGLADQPLADIDAELKRVFPFLPTDVCEYSRTYVRGG